MTAWLLVPRGVGNDMFSGPVEVVQGKSLAELIASPDVVWWPKPDLLVPFVLLPAASTVYCNIWNTALRRHELVLVRIPSSLLSTYIELKATDHDQLSRAVFALLQNKPSQLVGAVVERMCQGCVVFSNLRLHCLLDKCKDQRSSQTRSD